MSTFRKRVFTPALLIPRIGLAAGHLPFLMAGLLRPKTSPALREQVMLAVTSVNDCRYCDWVHTGLALKEKINVEELRLLLSGHHPGQMVKHDVVAILFAQH